MHVLVVEDEEGIGEAVVSCLRSLHIVDWARNVQQAKQFIKAGRFDIFLLDITLPDGNGLQLCQDIRETGITSPVIFLTGHSTLQEKVLGLDLGADDYITKPFSCSELLARVRAVGRRGNGAKQYERLTIGNLEISIEGRTVTHNDKPIPLRRKEFDLFVYLVRNIDRVVTRQMAIENVWGSEEDPFTNSVDVHIKLLRDKVDRPFGTKYIQTVHGVGYKFRSK